MVVFNETYDDEIRKLIDENPKNYISSITSKGFKGRYVNREYLLQYIINSTPLLNDEKYTLKTKVYWVLNHMLDFPVCKTCGCKLLDKNIKNINIGYPKYCSRKCQYKSDDWKKSIESGVISKYGVKNYFMTDNFKEYCCNHKTEILDKKNETHKINNTFNKSLKEDFVYTLLCSKFGKHDVETQYSNGRYPYNCDFYIKSLGYFIEFNGNWTHGLHAFDENSVEDIDVLKKWQDLAKTSNFYKNAIETWTVRDVNKRKTAELNNIKLYEFWNIQDLCKFFNIEYDKPSLYNDLILEVDNKQLRSEFDYYRDKDIDTIYSTSTRNLIIKYFQQDTFFKKEKEMWKDIEIRQKIIDNRVKYLNKSQDELTVMDILTGFKKSGMHYGYSHFNPLLFKYFIDKYSVKSCYDPCGGWGHRLLGGLNLEKYIYNDLSINTKLNVDRIIKYFGIKNTITYNYDATKFTPDDDFEAMFTCPPYFNLEHYECGDFKCESEFKSFIDSLFDVFQKKSSCKIFGLVIRDDMLYGHDEYCEKILIPVKTAGHIVSDKKNSEYMYIFKK